MTETSPTGAITVIAVVPTFRPDEALLDGLHALAPQVDSIIVVDDGSPADSHAILEAVEQAGFEVQRSARNAGIAAAINAGIRTALARGADYVLTIDQDTVLPAHYVSDCLTAFTIASPATRLGIVCTDRVNGQPSIPEHYTKEGLGLVREAIQSGFLISAVCLAECGLLDERLFIDCVDTEYCLRIARHGYRIAVGPGTDITHSLGEQAPLRPFGFPVRNRDTGEIETYEYHGPTRRYFITRNNVDLFLRYARVRPRWVISAIKREIGPTFTTIVSGPRRGRQLLATLVGAAHGLVRRRGPLSPSLRWVLSGSRS
ncbi:glycosyltransferase [Lacisediminihabitans sp.]|uniref:glycosyltransferase n=1 Tax=Lacisediminihabitans sp. TaxID=2787631 RepID=UPI00374DC4B9